MKQDRSRSTNSSSIERRLTPVEDLETYLSVLLYGRSGTGKTTLGCSFPGPIYLLDMNDKGTDSVRDRVGAQGVKVLEGEEWLDVEQSYWYLKKNPKKFKTVVVDTVSMMQGFAMNYVREENGGKNGRMLTKKDWGEISALMCTWLMNYRDLVTQMNVVFIAQDRVTRGSDEDESNDSDEQITPEVGPRLSPSVASMLNAAVNIIGNTFIQEKTTRIRTADKKIKKQKETLFCLRIGPHAYYTTKVRKPKSVIVPAFIVDPTYKKLVETLKE